MQDTRSNNHIPNRNLIATFKSIPWIHDVTPFQRPKIPAKGNSAVRVAGPATSRYSLCHILLFKSAYKSTTTIFQSLVKPIATVPTPANRTGCISFDGGLKSPDEAFTNYYSFLQYVPHGIAFAVTL